MDKRGKNEDEVEVSPFDNLQKNAVLHEARIFNDPQLNPRKCVRVMTKILHLIMQGESFSSKETTDLFFSVTKLFQSQDTFLRRMTYLLIKELKVSSDESFIVINCLSKDMTGKIDLFRGNSIRVLAKIIDAGLLTQIDRFLKQAVVEKNPFIVSCALVAGLHLLKTGPDTIKRWVNEVQEALNNKAKMAQYHALTLLYKIKQHDRLAISKVVNALSKNPPKGALAQCLLIRYISSVLVVQNPPDKELVKFFTDALHNKSSLVAFEAARAICRLPNLGAPAAAQAISILQEFLSSPLPTQRFAAVRVLSEVVSRYPALVASTTVDLEHLLTDQNRSIATLAITTLLKTGQESNVDRLMKSITGFISEISDEFKIVLVDAIKTLCLKFPHKYQPLMNFLAAALRDEGGADYKRAIVNAIIDVISLIPEAKEDGLEQFCEFIEDCEFTDLSVKILSLLGDEGPKTSNPAKYIRFIFNRVILENAPVRAAAVSSLARFGVAVPALLHNVIVLLKRCLNDNDDEVRDRVVFYLSVLQNDQKTAEELLSCALPVNLPTLEASLQAYIKNPPKVPFNPKKHLVEVVEESEKKKTAEPAEEKKEVEAPTGLAGVAAAKPLAANPYLELLNSIPEFAALGPLFKSSQPEQVTEEESEYQVSCVKHIYNEHVLFQFNITNTLEDQQLENVTVNLEPEDANWAEELIVPEAKLVYGVPGSAFVCLRRPPNVFSSGSISNELKFEVKEVDSASGTVSDEATEDQYQLEELEVNEKDFITVPEPIGLIEFKREWEGLGESNEQVKKYSLGLPDLQSAVDAVMKLLGMAACEDSATVPEDKRSHAVNLYGTFIDGTRVLCRAGFMMDQKSGVTLKIAVRSTDANIAALFSQCIR